MYRRILVATDGAKLSNKAVMEAARLAAALGAELLVLHVRSPLDVPHHATGGALHRLGNEKFMDEIELEESQLLDAAVAICAQYGVDGKTAFIIGHSPCQAIVQVAQDRRCDLIVMATRIQQGIPGFLTKSETQQVLRTSTISVLVVR